MQPPAQARLAGPRRFRACQAAMENVTRSDPIQTPTESGSQRTSVRNELLSVGASFPCYRAPAAALDPRADFSTFSSTSTPLPAWRSTLANDSIARTFAWAIACVVLLSVVIDASHSSCIFPWHSD